jgi:hypothetical protein
LSCFVDSILAAVSIIHRANFFIWRTKLKEHSNQLKYFVRLWIFFFFVKFLNYLFTRIRIIYVVCAFEFLFLCKIWCFTFQPAWKIFCTPDDFFEDYFGFEFLRFKIFWHLSNFLIWKLFGSISWVFSNRLFFSSTIFTY